MEYITIESYLRFIEIYKYKMSVIKIMSPTILFRKIIK